MHSSAVSALLSSTYWREVFEFGIPQLTSAVFVNVAEQPGNSLVSRSKLRNLQAKSKFTTSRIGSSEVALHETIKAMMAVMNDDGFAIILATLPDSEDQRTSLDR